MSRLLALLLPFALIACSQASGEPCQKKGDCDDGLVCDIARGSARGTCKSPSHVESTGPDAGEQFDASVSAGDLKEDASAQADASAEDDAG